jgi:hypothetical protein
MRRRDFSPSLVFLPYFFLKFFFFVFRPRQRDGLEEKEQQRSTRLVFTTNEHLHHEYCVTLSLLVPGTIIIIIIIIIIIRVSIIS